MERTLFDSFKVRYKYPLFLSLSVDPFTKKDWYDVKAPATFSVRNIGKTLVTRTQGKSKNSLIIVRTPAFTI